MVGSLRHRFPLQADDFISRERELPNYLLNCTMSAFVLSMLNQAHPFRGFSIGCKCFCETEKEECILSMSIFALLPDDFIRENSLIGLIDEEKPGLLCFDRNS